MPLASLRTPPMSAQPELPGTEASTFHFKKGGSGDLRPRNLGIRPFGDTLR
jgi:hypothetical protein